MRWEPNRRASAHHRTGNKPGLYLISILLLILTCQPVLAAEQDSDWFVSVYRAQLSGDKLFETLTLQADLDPDFWFWGIAFGKSFYRYSETTAFEFEAQYIDHHGRQKHNEFNAVFVVRWQHFPWDEQVRTSFAVGEGLSYASRIPVLEQESHDRAAQWLNYLLFEATLAPPQWKNWRFLVRVHHRSGIFGAISDVKGASNALGFGLRYDFDL